VSGTRSRAETMPSTAKGRSARTKYHSTLRVILALHALAVFTQAVLAGQFLSGVEQPVVFHEFTAWIILGLSCLQLVFAVLATGLQSKSLWFVIITVIIFLAEALQVATGYLRFLSVHIPLAVIIFGTLVWQLDYVFRKRALAGELSA
jgi:hypothetical protein